jgi:cytidyltransferase-like protein
MKRKAIIVSGYFNPIHKGPLEYFNNAKSLADELCVIVNSDLQRALKKSKEFQKEDERLFIVQNIKADDTAIISIEKDRTVSASIAHLYKNFNEEYDLGFAKCGGQDIHSIPEAPICNELGIQLIDGLGDKIQSSSWLLKNK